MTIRIGLLTIGQAPRPDLAAPLRRRLPGAELLEAGALDGLTAGTLPRAGAAAGAPGAPGGPGGPGAYPLTTRLADGTRVTLDEADLAPLVAAALDRLETAGVAATLLLCAGPFAGVRGRRPFVRPFGLVADLLAAAGVTRPLVLVPIAEQVEPARRKFAAAGFAPAVRAGSLPDAATRLAGWIAEERAAGRPPGAVVLDYVGHDEEAVAALAGACEIPLVDLGLAGAVTIAALAPRE